MKAFASLHTAKPILQTDNEVAYEGYRRVEINFDENFGTVPLTIEFPEILVDQSEIKGSYILVGSLPEGNGEIGIVIEAKPHLPLIKGHRPRIAVTNIVANKNGEAVGEGLPVNVNQTTRVIHHLILAGEMKAEDLHPKLYEAVNDELSRCGCAVIPVTRSGTGTLVQVFGSLSELGDALSEHIH